MSLWIRSLNSPLGPLTRTDSGSIETVTPDGTGIGCLPILDTARSPDLGQDLAAEALGTRVVAGHHAMRGRDDRGAHATEHLRYVLGIDVCALPGTRDAPQPRDCRAPVLGLLQADLDQLAGAAVGRRHERPRVDVSLLGENPCQLALQLRRGDLDRLMRGVNRVAHAREEVGYRVCHRHDLGLCSCCPERRSVGWLLLLSAALTRGVATGTVGESVVTTRTSSSPGSDRCAPGRAGRSVICRTSGRPPVDVRTGCNEYMRGF